MDPPHGPIIDAFFVQWEQCSMDGGVYGDFEIFNDFPRLYKTLWLGNYSVMGILLKGIVIL